MFFNIKVAQIYEKKKNFPNRRNSSPVRKNVKNYETNNVFCSGYIPDGFCKCILTKYQTKPKV